MRRNNCGREHMYLHFHPRCLADPVWLPPRHDIVKSAGRISETHELLDCVYARP